MLVPDGTLWPQSSVYPSMTWPVPGIPPDNANRVNAVTHGGREDLPTVQAVSRRPRGSRR